MRLVCAVLSAMFAFTVPAKAASAVTLVLQFDEAYAPASLDAMKKELSSIVGESGVKVDWRMLADVHSSDTFESLVVVHFRGSCQMQSAPFFRDERGYYAQTYISDGDVLPFSDVECGKIVSSISPAISKSQWKGRDSILGRALGRVLAHELYHMLTKTRDHGADGVTKSGLSAAQLVSGELHISMTDLENLHRSAK